MEGDSDHGGVWGDGSKHGQAAQGCQKVQSWEPGYPWIGGDMGAGECLWSRGQPGCPETEPVQIHPSIRPQSLPRPSWKPFPTYLHWRYGWASIAGVQARRADLHLKPGGEL